METVITIPTFERGKIKSLISIVKMSITLLMRDFSNAKCHLAKTNNKATLFTKP